MPVHKRTPGLDADYYVSGNTVRRTVQREADEPVTRRRERSAGERAQRHAKPVRDTRSAQERRRAQPARAYYDPEPATQRLSRDEVNRRTVQRHTWQRAEQERIRRAQEERERAEMEAEAQRRRQHRVQTLSAIALIAVLGVILGGGGLSLLLRYIHIDAMIMEQREVIAQIEDQQKRLEELQVEVNRQGNIGQIQDYARENLNMDYAKKENTRVITLP